MPKSIKGGSSLSIVRFSTLFGVVFAIIIAIIWGSVGHLSKQVLANVSVSLSSIGWAIIFSIYAYKVSYIGGRDIYNLYTSRIILMVIVPILFTIITIYSISSSRPLTSADYPSMISIGLVCGVIFSELIPDGAYASNNPFDKWA